MERVDVPGVAVPYEIVYALPHLIRSFVGECHAEYMLGQHTKFIHEIYKSVSECPRLSRSCPGYHPHKSLC